jgi:hypothetical protein
MIGCLWMCFDGYFEEEVGSRFVPWPTGRAAWDFDLYIEPVHRIGFTFARLWDSAYECLRQRGYQWTVSRISAFNAVSLKSHARLGAVRCGSLAVFRCGPLRLSIATMAPYVHLGYGSRRSPEYKIAVPATAAGAADRPFANASLTN